MFGPRTWCTKTPFAYRVVRHGYSLMSCADHDSQNIVKQAELDQLKVFRKKNLTQGNRNNCPIKNAIAKKIFVDIIY